jgi:hypothetical protein
MNILEVTPKENYVLYVRAEDGKTGLFDVKPFLDSEAFSSLKKESEFQRIHNGKYFIEWDCGADLSADTVFARWSPLFNENAQQGTPADARTSRR